MYTCLHIPPTQHVPLSICIICTPVPELRTPVEFPLTVYYDVRCHVHVCVCAGEKLSKQELQSNGIIKKLRQKDKQNDQLLAAQRYICTWLWLYFYVDHNIFIAGNFLIHFHFHIHYMYRQQIEDLEGKVKILKEQMKKKEENETKYQGNERVPP